MKTAVAFTVAASASAGFLDAQQEHIVSMPMHQYKQDCGTETHLRFNPDAPAFLQHGNVPGAGVDKFTPFKTVLKDGFLEVDCVKDYMYYRGDKFGDNKHDYKLGPVSDVSIVHYEAHVKKEDQVEMTQKVCFEFCRTIPNMGFFGIVNGRGCYCTPYFTAMESDSSQCDAVCEGDNALVCGGKSKSSVFAMHMCDSTKDDLSARSGTAGGLKASMDSKVKAAKGFSGDLQSAGETLQKSFGQVGDSAATGLAQNAKVFAGTVVHKAEDADEVAKKLGSLVKDANGLKDFTAPATVTKAERIMEGIDETVAAGEAVTDELDGLNALASPSTKGSSGRAKQYAPVMYFVDKALKDEPSTCSGDAVAEPITGLNKDGCAKACDDNLHSCVGFQYFGLKKQTCFLFSKFSTAKAYTGCKKWPFEATCFAKMSKFEGTTLKPDGNGKCKQCLTKLTKAKSSGQISYCDVYQQHDSFLEQNESSSLEQEDTVVREGEEASATLDSSRALDDSLTGKRSC